MTEEASRAGYRSIDPDQVVDTCVRLRARIDVRFPGRGIGRVCDELVTIARQARERAEQFERPHVGLRVLSAALVVATLGASIAVFVGARLPDQRLAAGELVQILEAAINDVVLIGAGVWFLANLERRIKRGRALRAIHELRAVVHIIDLHQLTKDPDRVLGRVPSSGLEPEETLTPFELGRYLDYCTEMLSLAGKVAALYVQRFDDEVALASVNEVETLASGLSHKIWQKIMVLDTLAPLASQNQGPPPEDAPPDPLG